MGHSLIGIDIGGTFTDIVAYDEELKDFSYLKLSSSVKPEESVMHGLSQTISSGKELGVLFHSTTVATNALLTRRGWPKVALVTTEGFRDVLEIGRQNRPELYNLRTERPKPIVPRHLRFTVAEKCGSKGIVEKGVDEGDLRRAAEDIRREKAEIVCISFINSYANHSNESLAKSILEGLVDVPVVCASDIDPLPKEYERTSTAAVSALLHPIVTAYLGRLHELVRKDFGNVPVYIMQSDGGATTIKGAIEKPISIIESGPASGVVSALHISRLLDRRNLLTFDMGGTTAKAGIIQDGAVEYSHEFEAAGKTHSGRSIRGSGYPVRFPFIDLAETSSGGGSIAWIDAGGALKVGPVSAGSFPGPACYDAGGSEPTITDANLVTGRLNQKSLLSGTMPISRRKAEEAIREKVADPLSVSVEKAATGIISIANNQMAKVMRIVSVERGYDPRNFDLVAFGGAGPLHAVDVALSLGMRSIIIPSSPGLFSAFGLITVDLKREYKKSVMKSAADTDREQMSAMYRELEANAVSEAEAEGWKGKDISFLRSASVQYSSQGWELTIPVSSKGKRRAQAVDISRLVKDFNMKHRQVYGYSSPSDPVNIVSLNLTSLVALPKLKQKPARDGGSRIPGGALKEERSVTFSDGSHLSKVYTREKLLSGNILNGPAVVEQYDSTSLIPSGWRGKVDPYGNLILRRLG